MAAMERVSGNPSGLHTIRYVLKCFHSTRIPLLLRLVERANFSFTHMHLSSMLKNTALN